LLTGAAFSLFTTALALTDVIRAILLFYLTPAWGTILGLLFLGERLDRARDLALLFAFVGLAVILGR
jgi:drug/metabolite transporter (DMT)-like permease